MKWDYLKKINKDEANNFLNEFYKMPFLFYQNNKILDDIKLNYSKKNSLYEDYLIYFENQWLQYFHNGMLNYQFLSKEQRSNSYIENYNRRIKLKLSKFLYGKNKCKITWPLFLYFIKQEEEDYRTDIYNKEKELTIKYKKIKKFKKIKIIKKKLDTNNEQKDEDLKIDENILKNDKVIWFKWKKNSCRYDSFSLIYALMILPKIEKYSETPENSIIDYLNSLFGNCLKLTEKELDRGFWEYLKKNKHNMQDLTTDLMCFKKKAQCIKY